MSGIVKVNAIEILDSRGNPTVETEVELLSGASARASVPSGASTGVAEAVELRDVKRHRFGGLGVMRAVENVNEKIAPEIMGMDACDQAGIDSIMCELDGTPNKSELGANAILSVSLAIARAAAVEKREPLFQYLGGVGARLLPMPMMNVINGGAHSDAPIDIQEFMIVPKGATNFRQAVRIGAEVFHALKKVLKANSLSTAVGDEGGFAPALGGNEEALEYIAKAVKEAGYKFGKDVFVAIDVAASEFYDAKSKIYKFEKSDNSQKTADDMVAYLSELVKKYPICSIEDGCAENDWEGWKTLTKTLGDKILLVGDDLFVTNTQYLKRGIDEGIANAILVKINQVGTLTETFEAVEMAKQAGYASIISHRSGETEDTSIADIAVALNTGWIKAGSLSRTDRTAKYNQLMRIEDYLGKSACFGALS